MKKLKLQALKFGAKEVLSKAQLKNVLGGSGSGSGSDGAICKLGFSCNLYVRSTGQTLSGTCYSQLFGRCFCGAQDSSGHSYESDPSVASQACLW